MKFVNSQKELTELLKKPKYQQSNLTAEERLKTKYLSELNYKSSR